MSASSKLLFIFVIVVAFVAGWVVNSGRVDKVVDTQALLKAELLLDDRDSEPKYISIFSYLKPLNLVNFWAPWCAPCREEMPVFEAMYRQHNGSGFQVLGITIDSPSASQAMLDSMDISYPVFYAESTGMKLMDAVGNPNGLLPYTLLLDQNGVVLEQKLGLVHTQDIERWIDEYLK